MTHVLARQSPQVQFPMQVKVMTEQETKEYHLKKRYELSLKSIGKMPQLVEPTDEQKELGSSPTKAISRILAVMVCKSILYPATKSSDGID